MSFSIGSRVQISVDYHWAKGAYGTISALPDFCVESVEGQGLMGDCWRLVNTTSGQQKFYWIVFDKPHYDSDGDGPYRETEIPEDMLIEQNQQQ